MSSPSTDPLIETLIGADSVSDALKLAARVGINPAELSKRLTEHSDLVEMKRPAESAAARFMAGAVATLAVAPPWPSMEHLSPSANEVLAAANAARGWDGMVSVLRRGAAVLDSAVAIAVNAWHVDLKSRGVPPEANGLRLALAIGIVLGGSQLAWAKMLWARTHELTEPRHAERHLRQALRLMVDHGTSDDQAGAAAALDGFYRRHDTLVPPGEPSRPSLRQAGPEAEPRGRLSDLPLWESQAYDLREQGHYTKAAALLDETLRLATELGDSSRELRLLLLRGLVFDDLSEYALAAADYEAAGLLANALKDEQRSFEAGNNLAANYLKRGETRRGIRAFKDVLSRVQAEGRRGRLPAAHNNLASAYAQEGNYEAATRNYLASLELLADVPVSDSHLIALTGLISGYNALGDEPACRAMGQVLLHYGLEQQDRKALVMYVTSAAVDLEDPEVVKLAEFLWSDLLERRDVFFAASITTQLARHDSEQGRPAEAVARLDRLLAQFGAERTRLISLVGAEAQAAEIEAEALADPDAAITRLREAVAQVERRLLDVASPVDGDYLLETAKPLYEGLIDLLVQGGTAENWSEAFDLSEAARPMTLTSAKAKPLERQIELKLPRTTHLDDVLSMLGLQDRQVGLVVFIETRRTVGAFVCTQAAADVTWVPLELTAEELAAVAAEIGVAFNGDPAAFPPRQPRVRAGVGAVVLKRTDAVRRKLGAVLPPLQGCDIVCVVPSRNLENFPFATLTSAAGHHLIEESAILVEPSVTALVEQALTEADPPAARQVFVAGVAAQEDVRPEFFETDVAIFADNDDVRALIGEAATPSAVLAGMADADIVHLACHGFVDRHDPLGSGLLLSDGTRRPTRRRQIVPITQRAAFELTVRDLAAASTGATLLTMRACSTARRSTETDRIGPGTLNRALHLAGCQTVVSTLWNVDQESSLAWFTRFHSLIRTQRLPPCDAMRHASREFIAEPGERSHLYHWAAFVMSGTWKWRNDVG